MASSVNKCLRSARIFSKYSQFRSTNQMKHIVTRKCSTTPIKESAFSESEAVDQAWLESRKIDITAGKKLFLFDTFLAINNLENAGLTKGQAAVVVDTMIQTMHAQMDHNQKNLVTKPQQEIATQQLLSHIASVRKDMIILEKSEFSQLKHEYEKQHIELQQLRTTLTDEIMKLKSGITLDLNLEKARSREDHGHNEKQLSQLGNRLDIKLSDYEGKLNNLDNKIDKESSQLLVTFERHRNDIIRYSGGTLMTCLGIILAFYRLWK